MNFYQDIEIVHPGFIILLLYLYLG